MKKEDTTTHYIYKIRLDAPISQFENEHVFSEWVNDKFVELGFFDSVEVKPHKPTYVKTTHSAVVCVQVDKQKIGTHITRSPENVVFNFFQFNSKLAAAPHLVRENKPRKPSARAFNELFYGGVCCLKCFGAA